MTTTAHRRTCRLIPPHTGLGPGFSVPQLVISNGIERRYFVTKINADSYALTRCQLPHKDPEEIVSYVVSFWSGSKRPFCDCADAQYRPTRPCKHISALAALRARGLI